MTEDLVNEAFDERHGERGTTLIELVIILGLIGVIAAMTIPAMANAFDRNKVFMGSELVAAAIRDARLAAIARNTNYRVRFECPSAGGVRVLRITGDPTIDTAADRCSTSIADDGSAMYLPQGVTYGALPMINVNGRGQMSVSSGTMPLNITVTYEGFTRTLAVSATGRVTTPGS